MLAALAVLLLQSPDPRAARMDSLFSAMTAATPGCAAGALMDGTWLHAKGYGSADVNRHIPITPTTVFNVGSVSKQFTALSIALLAKDGKLSLDDRASKYLP